MDASLVAALAGLVLGAAFVLAGAAKLASGPAWPEMAAQMGSPRPVTRALPIVEMVLGSLLMVGWQRSLMAVAALVILVVFTGQIIRQLRRGRRPMCACFGAWSATPLGWGHVARNAALMLLAVAVGVAGR